MPVADVGVEPAKYRKPSAGPTVGTMPLPAMRRETDSLEQDGLASRVGPLMISVRSFLVQIRSKGTPVLTGEQQGWRPFDLERARAAATPVTSPLLATAYRAQGDKVFPATPHSRRIPQQRQLGRRSR